MAPGGPGKTRSAYMGETPIGNAKGWDPARVPPWGVVDNGGDRPGARALAGHRLSGPRGQLARVGMPRAGIYVYMCGYT